MKAPIPPIGPTHEAPALPISPVTVSTATMENVSCALIMTGNDKMSKEKIINKFLE
jgi:hypothetical protein